MNITHMEAMKKARHLAEVARPAITDHEFWNNDYTDDMIAIIRDPSFVRRSRHSSPTRWLLRTVISASGTFFAAVRSTSRTAPFVPASAQPERFRHPSSGGFRNLTPTGTRMR